MHIMDFTILQKPLPLVSVFYLVFFSYLLCVCVSVCVYIFFSFESSTSPMDIVFSLNPSYTQLSP